MAKGTGVPMTIYRRRTTQDIKRKSRPQTKMQPFYSNKNVNLTYGPNI
jgi:hypothetical protein